MHDPEIWVYSTQANPAARWSTNEVVRFQLRHWVSGAGAFKPLTDSNRVYFDNTTSGLAATDVQDAVDELSQERGTDTTFIYNSSGGTGDYRFDVWADLISALGALPHGSHSICFEQAETIPTGTWDLNGAFLHGSNAADSRRITFADGATLTGYGAILARLGLELFSISTTPVLTMAGSGTVGIEGGCSMASRTAPFLQFTGSPAGPQVIGVANSSFLTKPSEFTVPDGGGDYECVEWTGNPGAAVCAVAYGIGEVNDDVLRATTELVVLSRNSTGANFSTTQTNAAGGVYLADATSMNAAYTAYDNATSGLTATQVQAALDELTAEKAEALLTVNTQTDNYELVLSDASKVVEMNKATAVTLTVPSNATTAFPIGTTIEIYAMGAGTVTVDDDGGACVIRNQGDLAAQYATASLRKRDTDEWVLTGELA